MIAQDEAKDRRALLEEEQARLLDWLIHEYQAEKVIVFGSFVTGRLHAWSDLDLVVIKQTDARFLDRAAEILDRTQPRVGVDLLVYTPEEWTEQQAKPFVRREILDRGRVIYAA